MSQIKDKSLTELQEDSYIFILYPTYSLQ